MAVSCALRVLQRFDKQASHLTHAKTVLRPGGWLILDVRKKGESRRAVLQAITGMGFKHLKSATSCALDRTAQECFRKIGLGTV